MEYLVFWLLFGLISAAIAGNKGLSFVAWFVVGILIGPFAILAAIFARAGSRCPYCKSPIHREATKCPRCQSDLTHMVNARRVSAGIALTDDETPHIQRPTRQ